jgi:hypothetical protein
MRRWREGGGLGCGDLAEEEQQIEDIDRCVTAVETGVSAAGTGEEGLRGAGVLRLRFYDSALRRASNERGA